jgi:hypothetical protein
VSLQEWLPEKHLAWFALESVAEMDLSAFFAVYRRDGRGRAAFEPSMMVSLLLYAYAIARFRARHEDALAELFSSVLSLCKQAGLVKVGV